MPLFSNKEFVSHSGIKLPFKIDCSFLSDDDIHCLAEIIKNKIQFHYVHGVPQGGTRLSLVLQNYVSDDGPVLIVDDVLTTGKSMHDARNHLERAEKIDKRGAIGVVIFARGKCPHWIIPMFQSYNFI
jgi:hypoxanthine phosphoribosyltransferase